MLEPEGRDRRFGRFEEPEEVEYQAISGLAVAALLVGLLAPTAFCMPLLWAVPLAGIVLGGLALKRISQQSPTLIGRKAAWVGLTLSLACAAAAPTEWFAYRWLLRREARQVARAWFDCLANDQPALAQQLAQDPRYRRPPEGMLDYRSVLEHYVSAPAIRSLLTLGERAQVRHYDTEAEYRRPDHEAVTQVYAVTYEEEGGKKTFFVALTVRRYRDSATSGAGWSVELGDAGFRPAALQGNSADTG